MFKWMPVIVSRKQWNRMLKNGLKLTQAEFEISRLRRYIDERMAAHVKAG